MASALDHADHFESRARQVLAARIGMWVFLGSEILLFGALFVLYAGGRSAHPEGFSEGVRHADFWIGAINTGLLVTASYLVAAAVHAIRDDVRRGAAVRLATAGVIALAFVVLKGLEYAHHVRDGALPGGGTDFYRDQPPGLSAYFTLYWIATGLHAVHVIGGALILATLAVACWRRTIDPAGAYRVELGGLYWHLVDAIWFFLWPLFYLIR